MQSIVIQGFESGLIKNKKPFLIPEDAFQSLVDAYCWRGEIKKREGLRLLGRLRRILIDQTKTLAGVAMTYTPAGTGIQTFNIFDIYMPTGTEKGAETAPEIAVGSVALPNLITLDAGGANETIFTDNSSDGILTISGASPIADYAWIDYVTGIITVNLISAPAGLSVKMNIAYYPCLPVMGIHTRETEGINDEQTVFFDQKYSYLNDGTGFQEFISPSMQWYGNDYDFFWATNYRGTAAGDRIFYVTNFINDARSPMRYTDGATWNTFNPVVAGTSKKDVLTITLAPGSASYSSSLSTSSIIKGTVVITVSNGVDPDVVFRDTAKDGTLVSSGSSAGTIDYTTLAISLTFSPVLPGTDNYTVTAVYDYASSYLFSARLLIPYYGRLLAFNTYEGETRGSSSNIYNRVRCSAIGDPLLQDAWRTDVYGKGVFLDAPVNEEIVGAIFYKSCLIVAFERSTWRLLYRGEYGLPFIWDRISTDFGSESTFSPILFDAGVLMVGDKAIVGSSANDVERIDLDIPDEVFKFKNNENGVKRVHGIRNFQKEIVYWCYTSGETESYFPDQSLIYNYRNNTWAKFRNNITCFGTYQLQAGITWDRLDVYWDDDSVYWEDDFQVQRPVLVCGNHQGFTHFLYDPGVQISGSSAIDLIEQESLRVAGITVGGPTGPVTLNIPTHNLKTNEYIYLTGAMYLDTSDITNLTSGSTTLNDAIYQINVVDADNIQLFAWDQDAQVPEANFSVTSVGSYIGGGVAALLPTPSIITKDFSPMKKSRQNIKTSSFDFLMDNNAYGKLSVKIWSNTTKSGVQGNLDYQNNKIPLSNVKSGYIENITIVDPLNPVITDANHGLLTGDQITIFDVDGLNNLNNGEYTVTFITTDTFSVSASTPITGSYLKGGMWHGVKADYFTLNSNYTYHRVFANVLGQFITLEFTYTPEMMFHSSTHKQLFSLNAMEIFYRTGGTNIFGR